MKAVIVGLLIVSAVAAYAVVMSRVIEQGDMRMRFEGACAVREGAVHDDLCVKDGRVVLTKDDLERLLQK